MKKPTLCQTCKGKGYSLTDGKRKVCIDCNGSGFTKTGFYNVLCDEVDAQTETMPLKVPGQ